MIQPKFSPGPWKHIPWNEKMHINAKDNSNICILGYAERPNVIPNERTRANALLISNAPEMFRKIVETAAKDGYQWAFDLVSEIMDKTISYDEMLELNTYFSNENRSSDNTGNALPDKGRIQ